MLDKSERFKVLKFLRICSIVGPLPTEVDLANWKLTVPSRRKQWICAVSYGSFILHTIYKNGRLAYAYFFLHDVQLYQLVIHAVLAMASVLCVLWYYVIYISDLPLCSSYVKATHAGNIGGSADTKNQLIQQGKRRLREYTIQDLVALSLPYLVFLAVPVVCSSYLYDSSMPLLLYTALPPRLQNWTTFGLLLVEEARFIMIMATIVTPMWQLQVIAFELLSKQLQWLIQWIQNGMQNPRKVYRILRSLQLYVSMLNNVNANLIFTWKLLSISASIISGYAAIAHFHEHPIFGLMYYFVLFDCGFIYTVIYEGAFKVPQLLEQAVSCALLRTSRDRTHAFKRQILSVRRTGIRVGEFHHMERTSTLIFMDYVVNNIVSMLVAFR